MQLEEKLKQDFAANIYEVTIMFRPEPQEEEAYDFGGRSPFARYRSGGEKAVGRVLVYGLGFAENQAADSGCLAAGNGRRDRYDHGQGRR